MSETRWKQQKTKEEEELLFHFVATSELSVRTPGLLISKYQVSPTHYYRYFSNINRVITDTFEKNIEKISPVLFCLKF